MSLTGLDLRLRARRRVLRVLDRLIAALEDRPAPPAASAPPAPPTPAPAPPPAAPPPAAPPAPAPPPSASHVEAPAPLPALPRAVARPPLVATPAPPTTTAAGARAHASPEERQRQHQARTRAGVLRFVQDAGGSAPLRAVHDYSESTFFVAHVGFSRLMEDLTDTGALDYDADTGTVRITDAGRAELG